MWLGPHCNEELMLPRSYKYINGGPSQPREWSPALLEMETSE